MPQQPDRKKTITFWIVFLVIFGIMNVMIYKRFIQKEVNEVGYNFFMKLESISNSSGIPHFSAQCPTKSFHMAESIFFQ